MRNYYGLRSPQGAIILWVDGERVPLLGGGDNVTLNSGTGGAVIRTDDDGTAHWQYVKVAFGADNTQTIVDATTGLPVSDAGGSITVDDGATTLSVDDGGGSLTVDNATLSVAGGGVEATALRVTIASDSTGVVSVDDNGGSLTVDNAALSVTGGGVEATALRVTIASDSTGVLSVDDNGGSLTVDGTVTVTDGAGSLTVDGTVTVQDGGGAITVDNAGTFAVQVDGSALTALQVIDNPVIVDDAAFTPATSSVSMAGFQADETATDSVDEGDAGAARMTLDRKVIVTPQPHTAGGLSIFRSLDLDETEEDVKTAAGCVYGMWVTNTATSTRFVKFCLDIEGKGRVEVVIQPNTWTKVPEEVYEFLRGKFDTTKYSYTPDVEASEKNPSRPGERPPMRKEEVDPGFFMEFRG